MAQPAFDALEAVFFEKAHPTITQWNRLEGRPRAATFDRALRCEVRDALWMLTRQWQVGEFIGDDAGSPVSAKVEIATSQLETYHVGTTTEPYDAGAPLEAKVERQAIVWTRAGAKLHYDLRLQLGRHWRKLLVTANLGAYVDAYAERYGFELPPDDRSAAAAAVYSNVEAWQTAAAIRRRAMDGGALYLHLKGGAGKRASDGIALDSPAHGAELDALGDRLVAWFDRLYNQPAAADAWQPRRLEYGFSCSAGSAAGGVRLVADEYPGGHLDWSSFDIDTPLATPDALGEERILVRSFLPSPLMFPGMPHTRWWKFEEGRVNFGDVSPATTDLAKLLLVEFALVYANDWFLLPFELPAGSLATVRGMTVTNSFGERFWIEAAGRGPESAWERWRMFSMTRRSGGQADTTMFLAPTVPKTQDGPPLDDVFFMRDEMANMVWAVEVAASLPTGTPRPGVQLGNETRAYHRARSEPPAEPEAFRAPIHYRAMTSVPEHWIPFVPVHVDGSSREIQLQRGAMLRLIDGDVTPPAKIEPLTATVRRGLEEQPKQPSFVHEEEVPRSGTRVTRCFQRTRWLDGATLVWLAMRKQTGRGGGASRLEFDEIAASPRNP